MEELLAMIKLLNVFDELGLSEYQSEYLHSLIMDLIELNRKNKK